MADNIHSKSCDCLQQGGTTNGRRGVSSPRPRIYNKTGETVNFLPVTTISLIFFTLKDFKNNCNSYIVCCGLSTGYAAMMYAVHTSETSVYFNKTNSVRQIPKVHHRIHNSPPPVRILGPLDPFYTPQPISLGSLLIPSPHLCLGLPSCLFPSGFPNEIKRRYIPDSCVIFVFGEEYWNTTTRK
jgi:hypothetical protein